MSILLHPTRSARQRIAPWFYRLIAVAWLVKAFSGWASMFGVRFPYIPNFVEMSQTDAIICVVFAGMDLVAAISLWLSHKWGLMVWSLIAIGYVATELFFYRDMISIWKLIAVISLFLAHFSFQAFLKLGNSNSEK